ncbi:MAG: hypothetical protein BVN34_04740 [Proteobacteria bacterium ST_bin12]|nr:MAG: hypothetical protein BVN34_04740 [Proteobacteria bacterium ST_bin12]
MSISETVSVVGLIFGVSGFVLGVMNYFRDRHKVEVSLQWDLDVSSGSGYDNTKKWGLIRVTNVGRRPTYISHVALKLPKGYDHTHLVIIGGINGKKLTEGDPTEIFMVTQENMETYANDWRKIIAQVSDSSGKVWFSNKLKSKECPSWAKASE